MFGRRLLEGRKNIDSQFAQHVIQLVQILLVLRRQRISRLTTLDRKVFPTQRYKVMGNILQRQASERAKRAGALGREEFAIKRGQTRDALSTKDKEGQSTTCDVQTLKS
jgi:hypothetical protein